MTRPVNRTAATVIVVIWIACAVLLARWLGRLLPAF